MDTHIIETREFTWKIVNFTKELLKINKSLSSEEFSIFLGSEETKWDFCIKLNNASFELYIHLNYSEADDFTVKFEGFVRSSKNFKCFNSHILRTRNEFKNGSGWGWPDFISIENICKDAHLYLKDKTLTIGLKVEVTKKKELKPVNTQSGNQKYLEMCKKYFNTKSLSDFTIVCSDGIELQTHKFILAAFSPVMEKMIDIKMEESRRNSVKISDINGDTMKEILRFIYTTEVNNLKGIATKLLYGAEKYELSQLKKLCVESMIENLSIDNALEYFLLADKYNSKALLYRSAVFIKLNLNKMLKKNWDALNKQHLLTLMKNFAHIPGEVEIMEISL